MNQVLGYFLVAFLLVFFEEGVVGHPGRRNLLLLFSLICSGDPRLTID